MGMGQPFLRTLRRHSVIDRDQESDEGGAVNDAGSDVVEELVEGPGEEEVKQEQTHEEQAALIKGVLQWDEDADGDSEGDADGDVELAPLFVLELVLELAVPLLLGQFEGQHCGQAQAQS